MTQRPSFWATLLSGTGQALPLAVLTALMGFGTLMINVQLQLGELKYKSDETLRILERSEAAREKAFEWLRKELQDLEDRVDRLEDGR